MTKAKLNFEKFELAVEECKRYQEALKTREENYKKMREYEMEADALKAELREPVKRPEEIDSFGILSYIDYSCWYVENGNLEYGYGEARIADIVDNNFIVNLGDNYTIPIDEIKEKGYYNNENKHLIFVDRINNSARFKEVIDIIVKQRKTTLLHEIESQKKWIKEQQDKLKILEDLLPQFDDYKIGNVDKIAKNIDFPLGLKYEQIEEFENDFPRVYKV